MCRPPLPHPDHEEPAGRPWSTGDPPGQPPDGDLLHSVRPIHVSLSASLFIFGSISLFLSVSQFWFSLFPSHFLSPSWRLTDPLFLYHRLCFSRGFPTPWRRVWVCVPRGWAFPVLRLLHTGQNNLFPSLFLGSVSGISLWKQTHCKNASSCRNILIYLPFIFWSLLFNRMNYLHFTFTIAAIFLCSLCLMSCLSCVEKAISLNYTPSLPLGMNKVI